MRELSIYIALIAIASLGRSADLSLHMAARETLDHNPALAAARRQAQITKGDAYQILAPYDARLGLFGGTSLSDTPSNNPFFPAESEGSRLGASLSGNLPIGTKLKAEYSHGFNNLVGAGPMFSPNPYYNSNLSLSVTQSLLRDLWYLPGLAALRAGMNGMEAADLRVKASEEAFARQTLAAYALWVFFAKNLEIKERSLAEAVAFHDKARRKYASGLQENSELLQAESTRHLREIERLDAQEQLAQARERLWLAMGREADQRLDDQPLAPDSASWTLPQSEAQALEWALARRLDWKAGQLDLEQAKDLFWVSKSDALPNLDLSYTYGMAGLKNSLDAAATNLLSGDHISHQVNLSLSVPFLNFGGKGRRDSFEGRYEVLRASREQGRRLLAQEVAQAWRAHQLARAKAELAARRLEIEARKMREVEGQYGQGRISGRELLLNRDDLLRAEVAAAGAAQDLLLTQGGLLAATGTLMPALGLEVKP